MTDANGETVRRARGRPRAPGVEDKIMQAALEEYTERGWSGFTMDAVARRAGVGKSTVYLRWSDKDALLTDAIHTRTQEIVSVDTGSLVGDLTELTSNVFHHVASAEGWASFRVVMDAASTTEHLGRFTEEAAAIHREVMAGIFERARARGEWSGPIDLLAVTDTLYGAAVFFTLGHRLDRRPVLETEVDARVTAIVAMILDGIRQAS